MTGFGNGVDEILTVDLNTTSNEIAFGSSSAADTLKVNNMTRFIVAMPSTQTIASGNTITDDACGGLKRITATGAVTTSTTNTFTAPASANAGCLMYVCNVGTNTITLDSNANNKLFGAADVAVTQDDCVAVASTGASGVWYQVTPLEAN